MPDIFHDLITHIINQCRALDVKMLFIQSVLEHLHDVVSLSIPRGESLGPCKKSSVIESGLFDGEAESEAEVKRVDFVFHLTSDLSEEGIHTVCHVV